MDMAKHAVVSVKVPVQFIREGKYFVAYCPVLDISTQATSFEKVQHRFNELMNIFFEEMLRDGKLDKYLTEMGWIKRTRPQLTWEPPYQVVSKDLHEVHIPCPA